jgi:hypothetical protein
MDSPSEWEFPCTGLIEVMSLHGTYRKTPSGQKVILTFRVLLDEGSPASL